VEYFFIAFLARIKRIRAAIKNRFKQEEYPALIESEPLYYRSLSQSSNVWRSGKEIQGFPPDCTKDSYLRHMKTGKGFPSIWQSSKQEDLEKIALGISLGRDSFNKVELIGFNKLCFEQKQIKVEQTSDLKFPLKSASDLHHELIFENDNDLVGSIELFLLCNGELKRFPRKSTTSELGLIEIMKKYLALDEIDEKYIDKAKKWIERYDK
jgi:hypothetical protein